MVTRPGHKYPLRTLHDYLEEFVSAWRPDDEQQRARVQELVQQALEAAKSYDEESFFDRLQQTVDHAIGAYRQELSKPEWGDRREELLKLVQKDGNQLLNAKEGKWKAGYWFRSA
jgi:hypothetical protein